MADTARRIRGDRVLTPEQLLVRFTDFACANLGNPAFAQLSPPVRLYYLLNPMHPGPGDVLRWGSDYRGGCGSHTRVVIALLRASGVESRPLFLLNDRGKVIHTVVHAHIEGRWVVSDPYFGIVFRRRDGTLATVEDIAADERRFREQVDRARGYVLTYDYDRVSLMNWEKVPVVLPAVHDALVALIGAERVKAIARPSIWMWPRAMLSAISLALAVLAAGLAEWRPRTSA